MMTLYGFSFGGGTNEQATGSKGKPARFRCMWKAFASISKTAVMRRTRFGGGCVNLRHWIGGCTSIV